MLATTVQSAVSLLTSADAAVVFVGIFLIAYLYCKFRSGHLPETTQSFRLPPRLKSFPVVGSIPYLPVGLHQLHKFFMEKLPTMGPVIGFNLMSRNVVVLQSREAIADAFARTEISNRPFKLYDERFKWAAGITVLNYNSDFKRYHHLVLTILKEFGFGEMSGVMESRIQEEVGEMIVNLKASENQPTDPSNVVNVSVMNVIAGILFGKRFGINDSQARDFLSHNSEFNRSLDKATPFMSIPALRYIPYFKRALDDFETLLLWYQETLQKKIIECENDETRTPCFIRSFIDAEGRQGYNKNRLNNILRDFVIAGSETSATTVLWSIVLLANHQDVQVRLQTEIDNTVSRTRLPSTKDQLKLTIVEAFILEVMRYRTVVPMGVAHGVSKDVIVQGFYIPVNTMVIPSLYAVHMSPDIWEDPSTFRPERFIDKEGKLVNQKKVIPFSIGKRSCLGEQLARQEIFLFITGLLQNYTILPPADCSAVECREISGGFTVPSPYSVRFVPRR